MSPPDWSQRPVWESGDVTYYIILDEDCPPAIAAALVNSITTEKRDPKYILLGHKELRQLRQWTHQSMYALAKQRGNTITFRGIDVIEVCRDSFLDVC